MTEQQAGAAGGRWFTELMQAIDTLEFMPRRCAVAAESAAIGCEVRELLFGARGGVYRVIFQIHQRMVFVLHVRHAARDQLSRDDLQ